MSQATTMAVLEDTELTGLKSEIQAHGEPGNRDL